MLTEFKSPINVLLIDDRAVEPKLIEPALTASTRLRFSCRYAYSMAEAMTLPMDTPADVIFLNLDLPGGKAPRKISDVQRRWPGAAIIAIAGTDDQAAGLAALGGGAQDYLIRKEYAPEVLERCVLYALERKKSMDRLVRHTRDLQRANEDLNRFASVASHDLKAPLRGILHLTQMIEEDLGEGIPGETREKMDFLRKRVSMMNDLLTRLLEYARTGLDHTQVEQIHVGEMVRDIVEMLDLPTGFSVEADPSLPTLHTARTPLQQVLQNLISNAVRYNDKSDGRVRVHATHEGPWHTRISVTDNGPGIDPRFSGKVFEIFQTLRPKDEVESTGVGLAIVKKIVESLGCRVGLDSRPGFGATFHFTWPLHWPHQDDQAPPPEAALEAVPIRVDD